MKRAMVIGAGWLAASAALGISSAAAAAPRDAAVYQQEKDGYGYVFPDDPLNAGVFGANDVLLKIRSSVVRRTLIRPRTHFMPELLKSTEGV